MATNFGGNRVISRNRGFGLIEIMVGLVVGLVTMIVIMQVASVFEGQKRAVTSGGDAQTNGALALYAMEREIRGAGNGMTESVPYEYTVLAGCTTRVADTADYLVPSANPPFTSTVVPGGQTRDIRFAPVIVSDGGGGASDALTIVYGTSAITAPYLLTRGAPFTPGDATISLDNTSDIRTGDMVALVDRDLIASPRPPNGNNYIVPTICSLMQATAIPAAGTLNMTGGRYNRANGLPAYSDNDGQLFNLGRVNIVTYRIAGNDLVADITQFGVIPDGTPAGLPITNRTNFSPLASNIVNMQAQYGVDTGNPMGTTQTNCRTTSPGALLTTNEADGVVDGWVDATGTWANNGTTSPTLFDLRRIRAVRIGLVARSGVQEPPNRATGLCDTTTTAPVISWSTGPNMTPNLAGDPNWQCYRYKVFQATIPVRNALWSSNMNPASSTTCGLRDPA